MYRPRIPTYKKKKPGQLSLPHLPEARSQPPNVRQNSPKRSSSPSSRFQQKLDAAKSKLQS
jgi:hypothetical protein